MIDADLTVLSAIRPGAVLVNVRGGEEFDAARIGMLAREKAGELAGLGLSHGDRVVIAHEDPARYVIAVFACWIAGLTAVAVNPDIPADEQANILAATGALAVVGTARAALPEIARRPASNPVPLGFDEPALILMTSGTTGRPKGIVHSLRGLMARVALNIGEIGRDTLADTLDVLPVFFGHGLIGNIMTPLFAGGRVHLWPTPDLAELRTLAGEIASRRIGFMSSVPSFWKLALRVSPRPQRPLARIHVGSAPLSRELWSDIAAWGGTRQVYNMFGMTETANWIGGGGLEDAAGADGHVGRAWGGMFGVRDEKGHISLSGRGEIVVQTPSIMLGYWRRPDLDSEAFAGAWFRTGDTGEIDGEGRLVLSGRIKSEINVGGIKVQAEEVDMLLERHEAIAEACAFGIPHPVAGEVVAAAIVLKEGAGFDPEAIKAWCRVHARADAVPVRIDVLPAIPRNDRGKVVRADVRLATERTGR